MRRHFDERIVLRAGYCRSHHSQTDPLKRSPHNLFTQIFNAPANRLYLFHELAPIWQDCPIPRAFFPAVGNTAKFCPDR